MLLVCVGVVLGVDCLLMVMNCILCIVDVLVYDFVYV